MAANFNKHFVFKYITAINIVFGPGSFVGIVPRYGLDGSGIEYHLGGEIFRTRPDRR